MERWWSGRRGEWRDRSVEGQDRGRMGREEGCLWAGSLMILRLQQSCRGQAVAVSGAGVGACASMEGLKPQGRLWSKWGLQAALGLCVPSQAGRWGRCVLVPCQACAGPREGHSPRQNCGLCHPITGASSPTASRQGLGSQWFCESESSAEPRVGGSVVQTALGHRLPAGPWAQPLLGAWRGVQTPERGRPSWMQGLWGGARRGSARTSGLPSDQGPLEKACPPAPQEEMEEASRGATQTEWCPAPA